MEKLMLSADGEIMLYEVSKNIINDFDNILDDFYDRKKIKCYNEQLFVKFLQVNFGCESVKFIKNLGYFNYNNLPKEYKNIKWYNF